MMRWWINVGFVPTEQIIPLARAVEAAGLAGVTVADHLLFPAQFGSAYPYSKDGQTTWPADAPWPDPWVTLAAIGAATERIELSTSVFIAPLRDLFSLAKATGTASLLSGGRLLCGFGAGWLREEFEAVGMDFASRGARFDEMLDLLPRLWTGDDVEHRGRFYDFAPLRMCPGVGPVPIIIGGNTIPAMRRAVRHEGWLGAHSSIDETRPLLEELSRQRADAQAMDKPFRVILTGTPKMRREVDDLAAIGVDTLVMPAATLTRSTALDDRVEAIHRFAREVGAAP